MRKLTVYSLPADLLAAAGQGDQVVDLAVKTLRSTVLGLWLKFVAHLPFLCAGVLLILLTWLIAWGFSRFGERVLGRFHMSGSLRALFVRLITIGIWMLGLLLAATMIFPGLTPASALGTLGIASLAVGFAFKDIFENFFAGILILWRFPFENGDYLEVEGISGRVVDVTVRMTLVRETTGELVVLPNSFLFKNPVRIFTDRPRRRISITVGIAYGEDAEAAVRVIQQALTGCPTVMQEQPVQVFAAGFGESSIDIEVTWWTGPKPVDLRRSRGEVVLAVKKALDAAGIEIPFPYRTLTFKEPLETTVWPGGSGRGRGSIPPRTDSPAGSSAPAADRTPGRS